MWTVSVFRCSTERFYILRFSLSIVSHDCQAEFILTFCMTFKFRKLSVTTHCNVCLLLFQFHCQRWCIFVIIGPEESTECVIPNLSHKLNAYANVRKGTGSAYKRPSSWQLLSVAIGNV